MVTYRVVVYMQAHVKGELGFGGVAFLVLAFLCGGMGAGVFAMLAWWPESRARKREPGALAHLAGVIAVGIVAIAAGFLLPR